MQKIWLNRHTSASWSLSPRIDFRGSAFCGVDGIIKDRLFSTGSLIFGSFIFIGVNSESERNKASLSAMEVLETSLLLIRLLSWKLPRPSFLIFYLLR